jgi:MFS family permease
MTDGNAAPKHATGLRAVGRALVHRNYRLFFFGQGVSMIGTWMTRIATGWFVFRLAEQDAPFLLGLVGFTGQAPTFFLAPFAGALVDRWNRHRTLVVTQVLALIQSALLAVVAFSHQPASVVIGEVLVLSLFQGLINAFDMPARQAILVEIVERREDLPNAIALNSSLVNGSRLIGPSLAGVIIAAAGEAWCFLIDALSYLAVVAALLAMRLVARPRPPRTGAIWHEAVEGFRYAFGFPPIRSLLLLLALVSFMGMPYTVLLPIIAADVLQGGPRILGLLSGASGLGAVAGALYLASRQSVLGLGGWIIVATTAFGLGLVGLALSRSLPLSLVLMMLAGFGMMVQLASSNTILQTIVEEDKRGRVMSFYSMAFLGMAPFGSLFAGSLAGVIGAPATILIGGIACLVAAAVFAWGLPRLREHVRPIYVQKGILPEIATGMQTAAELTRPPEE